MSTSTKIKPHQVEGLPELIKKVEELEKRVQELEKQKNVKVFV